MSVDYSVSGAQGANGWYVGPVTVRWTVSADATSTTGCEAALLLDKRYQGHHPDLPGRRAERDDRDDDQAHQDRPDAAHGHGRDARPSARRRPAGTGRRSTVDWSGSDATSGIDSCTRATYAGPDGPATLQGACTDAAGNTSAPAAFGLGYDATAPELAAV